MSLEDLIWESVIQHPRNQAYADKLKELAKSYDNGWNKAVESLCNRIEELDTDMFTPKQISEYLYDAFFKQED